MRVQPPEPLLPGRPLLGRLRRQAHPPRIGSLEGACGGAAKRPRFGISTLIFFL